MASTLNEDSVERKLQNVTNTQDGIQSLSLWIIHHKVHHKKIVELWLKVLKKAKTAHRLTLFNLCNDVVQNCKKKQAKVYMETFKGVLKDAVTVVKDSSIRSSVERLFSIWENRSVFDSTFVGELQDLIADVKSKSVNLKILTEFKTEKLIEKISSFKKLETEVEGKFLKMTTIRLDASNLEAVKQLKDRAHGKEFSKQFEDSCNKLNDYVSSLEKEIKDRTSLIAMLEQSEVFYEEQFQEAKIVANAYKNFGSRVAIVKKKLDDLKSSLPDPPSPIPSPTPDAPSPGSTPPADTDNTEAVDMDLSDSDNQEIREILAPVPLYGAQTTTTKSILQPIPSTTEIKMKIMDEKVPSPGSIGSAPSPVDSPTDFNVAQEDDKEASQVSYTPTPPSRQKDGSDSLEKRIASILPNLQIGGSTTLESSQQYTSKQRKGSSQEMSNWSQGSAVSAVTTVNSSKPLDSMASDITEDNMHSTRATTAAAAAAAAPPPPSYDSSLPPDEGSSTPLNDEGGGTPVQDEKEEANATANPIDFLTKLINQSQKTSESTSSFLQNLLSNTIKNQMSQLEDKESVSCTKQATSQTASQQIPLSVAANQSPLPASQQPTQSTPPQTWAAWKAQHAPPDEVPPPVGPAAELILSTQQQPSTTIPPNLGSSEHAALTSIPNLSALAVPQRPDSSIVVIPSLSSPRQSIPLELPFKPPDGSLPWGGPHEHVGVNKIGNSLILNDSSIINNPAPTQCWEPNPKIKLPLIPLPVPPPKGVLRNASRPALKEFSITSHSDNIPPSSALSGVPAQPKPPPQPPSPSNSSNPLFASRTSRLSIGSNMQSGISDDQREFIEKLKRKTTTGSLITPPSLESQSDALDLEPMQQTYVKNPVRPNLTTINIQDSPLDSNTDSHQDSKDPLNSADRGKNDDQSEQEEENEEPKGIPISTLAGINSRRVGGERRENSERRERRIESAVARRFEQPEPQRTEYFHPDRRDRDYYRHGYSYRDPYYDWERYYGHREAFPAPPPSKRPYEPYERRRHYYPPRY